jgi:hypothetical protein
MVKLTDYRGCVSAGLKGKKFPNVIERRKAFCILTKLCSKKAKDEKEALELCLKKNPKWA